jgi:hypothetical protein
MATLGVTRDVLHKFDSEELYLNPRFLRWLFTILDTAGIWTGYFHPEVAVLAAGEGRRGLGLDILTDLAAKTGKTKEEVLLSILAEEIKTQKEVSHAPRTRDQHTARRASELGEPGAPDDTE